MQGMVSGCITLRRRGKMQVQSRHIPNQLTDGIPSGRISLVEIVARIRLPENLDRIVQLRQVSIGANVCRCGDIADFVVQTLAHFLDGVRETGQVCHLSVSRLFDDARGEPIPVRTETPGLEASSAIPIGRYS